MADQAISSVTNLAASVVVAREATVEGFGAFGVAFLLYLLAVGITRALAAEPFVVRHSDIGDGATPDPSAPGAALGVAIVCGVLGGVLLAAAAVALDGDLADALLPVAVLLPLLLLQDVGRYVLVARRRARRAVASDVAWAALLVPAFGLALGPGDGALTWLVAAWAGAGSIAGLVVLDRGLVPSAAGARAWWRDHGDLAPRFAAEFLAGNGARHLSFVLVGAVSGTAAVGAVRAVQVLFGPFNVLQMGAQLAGVPEAVRVRRERPEGLGRFGLVVAAVLAGGALALGTVALLLPDGAGEALFGDSWAAGRDLVPYQMVGDAAAGTVVGALLVLRALEAADQSLRARLTTAPVTLVGVLVGAAVDDARGAMVGLVASQVLAAAVWRWRAGLALDRASS